MLSKKNDVASMESFFDAIEILTVLPDRSCVTAWPNDVHVVVLVRFETPSAVSGTAFWTPTSVMVSAAVSYSTVVGS